MSNKDDDVIINYSTSGNHGIAAHMVINDNTGKLISNVEWNESKRIKIKNAQEVVFKLSNHIGSKKYLIKPGHTYHVFFGTIGHFFGFSIISIDDTTEEEK